ncbi:MAG: flavodoxin family protein [Armatimonadota bacterium]
MSILYLSGSPRKNSNTDYLLDMARSITGGEFIKLADYEIAPCTSCWGCTKAGMCTVKDDMTEVLIPKLLDCSALVIGSPVYFNNVSAQVKAFMDRTWCVRDRLANRIGGAIVVGRRYGAESAITAIHSYFTKLEMIPANRGVCGIAYASGEIEQDEEAIAATRRLAARIQELLDMADAKDLG